MRKRHILAAVVSGLLGQNLINPALPFLISSSHYDPHHGTRAIPGGFPSTNDSNWADDDPDEPKRDAPKEESREKKDKHSREANDEQLNDALRSTICVDKSKVKWDDVAGLKFAKKELQMAAELPVHFPKLFTGQRQPRRSILLYGPPGTGKGHLVKALAAGVDSTLFIVSSSDMLSKWHGESERSVAPSSALSRNIHQEPGGDLGHLKLIYTLISLH